LSILISPRLDRERPAIVLVSSGLIFFFDTIWLNKSKNQNATSKLLNKLAVVTPSIDTPILALCKTQTNACSQAA